MRSVLVFLLCTSFMACGLVLPAQPTVWVHNDFPPGDYLDQARLSSGEFAYFGEFNGGTRGAVYGPALTEIGTNSHLYRISDAFVGNGYVYGLATKASGDTVIVHIAETAIGTGTWTEQSLPSGAHFVSGFFTTPAGVGFVNNDGDIFVDRTVGNFEYIATFTGMVGSNYSSGAINLSSEHVMVTVSGFGSFYKILTFDGMGNFTEQSVSLGPVWRFNDARWYVHDTVNNHVVYSANMYLTGPGGAPENGVYRLNLNLPAGNQVERIVESSGDPIHFCRYTHGDLDGYLLYKDALDWEATLTNGTSLMVEGFAFVPLALDTIMDLGPWLGGTANFLHQVNGEAHVRVGTAISYGTSGLFTTNGYNTGDGWEISSGLIEVDFSYVAVDSIEVAVARDTVQVGDTTLATATVLPDTADNPGFTWTVSDTAIASIDSNGVMTGRAGGVVRPLATTDEDSTTYTGPWVVIERWTDSLAIVGAPDTIETGLGYGLDAVAWPSDITTPGVTWQLMPGTASAELVSTSFLRATSPGDLTVTIEAVDGSGVTASRRFVAKEDDTPTDTTGLRPARATQWGLRPNPTDGLVRLSGMASGPYQVVDLLGRVVARGQHQPGHPIDMTELHPGVYAVVLNGASMPVVVR